jgi:hypothetical protein
LLTVTSGSSLDQHSNNVSLFNLIEQLNIPANAAPPPRGVIPLELHAYFVLRPAEVGTDFYVRFSLVAETGLETYSQVFKHRSVTSRYRTRTLGLPLPPVVGQYELRVDVRLTENAEWERLSASWPVIITELNPKPKVTH